LGAQIEVRNGFGHPHNLSATGGFVNGKC
jgi:hypothetical protein